MSEAFLDLQPAFRLWQRFRQVDGSIPHTLSFGIRRAQLRHTVLNMNLLTLKYDLD